MDMHISTHSENIKTTALNIWELTDVGIFLNNNHVQVWCAYHTRAPKRILLASAVSEAFHHLRGLCESDAWEKNTHKKTRSLLARKIECIQFPWTVSEDTSDGSMVEDTVAVVRGGSSESITALVSQKLPSPQLMKLWGEGVRFNPDFLRRTVSRYLLTH